MKNILSFDVEDWFHILDLPTAPDIEAWHRLEPRVEQNLYAILDILDLQGTKATMFVLGWIAERYPQMIKETHRRGHEIASHGYAHQLVYTMAPDAFLRDITKTKDILEDLVGERVLGHRSPGFSITPETPWAFDALTKAGYLYDSSVFPARRAHGGFVGASLHPHQLDTINGPLTEFPISMAAVLGAKICFSGGGYFRLFPWSFISARAAKVNAEGRPVIYYLHPREIDPHHPRLPMGVFRRFKSYVNLSSTETKLRRLVQSQVLTNFRDWLRLAPLPIDRAPSQVIRQ